MGTCPPAGDAHAFFGTTRRLPRCLSILFSISARISLAPCLRNLISGWKTGYIYLVVEISGWKTGYIYLVVEIKLQAGYILSIWSSLVGLQIYAGLWLSLSRFGVELIAYFCLIKQNIIIFAIFIVTNCQFF